MSCDSREFFDRLRRELEQRNILHTVPPSQGAAFPTQIEFKVAHAALGGLRAIQMEIARQSRWALVQTFEQGAATLDTVLVNLEKPGEMLRLVALADGAASSPRQPKPMGLCLAVLGSDGAGKSTLLAQLQTWLQPCFLHIETFHFRPRVFEGAKSGVVTDPHGRPPRNIVSSWLKTAYYYTDHVLGWFTRVRPAVQNGSLVIFDRNFDDLLVDQRRYRMQGIALPAKILRRLLPSPDRTFILSAPAEILHNRKPELPLEELLRQQRQLRALAGSGKNHVLLAADQPAGQVAADAWRTVVALMAAREEKRN